MLGLNSLFECFYTDTFHMKGTTFNSPLLLQVCSNNIFGNIALKTKTDHIPTCMHEFVVELSYTNTLFFLQ